MEDSTGETDTTEVATPDPDIKAIMTVIRRRTRSFGHGEPERIHLRETDLTRAELSEANLSGAELSGARNVTQAQLEESAGNEATRLPSDREPPAHWNVKTNEQIEGD